MAAIEPETAFINKAIPSKELPDYRLEILEHVSKRLLSKIVAGLSVFLIIVLIVATVLYIKDLLAVRFVIFGIFGALFLIGLIFTYHFFAQKNYGFVVREKDILFQKGVLVIKTTIIPFNRVQHVSTTQSLLDKYFKLKNVKIFTAGGQGSDIKIPGLTPEKALHIKEWIAHKIVDEEVDE
ncbi:PH domain-containing protein [Mesonia ostreae]|uniref:PH domain-containing protein n=1 Tax=Mesonia ostreae TaxID=861110 RepID=A0ABU2KKC4_9FLAO|nr:PH domain-containing protein [Mesonia ostreae]MDT0295129.1 PH domain-containing protein [Mesonia ostreae]